MPIVSTKSFLTSSLASGSAFKVLPAAPGDFQYLAGSATPQWLAGTADMNGDGRGDLVFGSALSDANGIDSGRVVVELAPLGGTTTLGAAGQLIINGGHAGDLAGAAVAGLADVNGDGRGDVLIGAPGVDVGALTNAGAAFVVYGSGPGTVNLADVYNGVGGYAIKGEAVGDNAGANVIAIKDMNGDGVADYLVGATGNDQNGTNAGAVYVVWGGASSGVNLSSVAAGTGGFKILGAKSNDAVGSVIGTVKDMNGDGIDEILIGSPDSGSGKIKPGVVYVVFGKVGGGTVNLASLGTQGFAINGILGDRVGQAVTGIGDVNGDGLGDMLVAAPTADHAYVVFGKAGNAAIDLNNVKNGIGGFEIVAEQAGDLKSLSVTGGTDLNHDGIADIVIGAQNASDGGNHTGAVYVIWGGATSTVYLANIAASQGGAKIVGTADSNTGASVAITGDLNGDCTADLLIGAPGIGESAYAFYTPGTWQPDINVFGSVLGDTMGLGYKSGGHAIGNGADNVMGLGGNDSISTFGGNDTLDGGAGADTMAGGSGDDTYWVDNALDVVVENSGEGTDTVNASVSYTLGANVENLVLTGFAMSGTGNDSANVITGTSGNDTLDGGAGADTLIGGAGNDTYRVDNADDVITESAGGGTDTVIASASYTLGDNVENLTLAIGGLTGTGNALNNTITGAAGADTIDGGAGNDFMAGGAGNDTYYVDSAGDTVSEVAGGGIDTVIASVDYTIAGDVENLVLTAGAHSGTGNALNNRITGTEGNDTLDGGLGGDTLIGGLGDDTFKVDNAGDVVVELDGMGTDTVIASVDYTLTSGSIENLTLTGAAHHGTGNDGNNVITGTGGADVLDGAGGLDTLIGGTGNDTYVIDSLTDTIIEQAGGGIDTVLTSLDYTLDEGSQIENVTLTGAAHHAVGNSGDNALTGGAGADLLEGGLGNDVLNGMGGADTMDGGLGDDTYFIDNPGDVVIEGAGGGIDTVVVSTDWTLADNIENVKLVGSGHTLTGNAADNTLTGDTGDDILDGGEGDDVELGGDGNDVLVSKTGVDHLVGGSGNDTYKIHGGEAHIEDFQGHDTIDASEAYGNSYIDLSGETQTEIEGHNVYYGNGGTVTGALNVQFLQDLTGSFGDDIANVRLLVPQIVDALQSVSGGAAFGVSSFRDKVWGSFGGAGDYVYKTELAIGATAATLTSAYNGFVATGGADEPESQLEALLQLAVRAGGEVGYQTNSARIAVMFTDAHFHTAADGTAQGITVANNGDAIINNGGIMENYPELAQLKVAIEAANIIPVFAVIPGLEATYQGLVNFLGRGTVVTLTTDSSNIVSAITTGLATATTTHISDAIGGYGDDTLIGNFGDNVLTGNGGNDTLKGAGGKDVLHGGEGDDTAVYSGAITDYTVTRNADGTVTVADHRTGVASDGTDTLDSIEHLLIGGTTYSIDEAVTLTNNRAPVIGSNGGGATAAITVTEGGTAVTTVTAIDPEGSALTYSISGGADAALFAIDQATGILSFLAAPSFAAPADSGADNVYDVQVSVSDGSLNDTQALAVTVARTNVAPELTGAQASLAAGLEDTAYTVTATDLLAGYSDADGDTLAVSAVTADHGTVTVNADGSFTITPVLNYNGPVALSYTVSDGHGGAVAATQNFNLAPAPDAATISGTATGDVTEDGALLTGGTLAVTDPDAGQAGFVAADPASLAGTYGAFTFDATTGAWTYALDNTCAATQALNLGETATETLTVASIDGTTKVITVSVHGAYDGPAISGSAIGSVIEDAAISAANGQLTIVNAAFAAADPASLAGTYGSFAFNAATGDWSYSLDNASSATQGLLAGQTVTETLTVASTDGSVSQTISVTVTGTNDAASITGTSTGTVAEDVAGSTGGTLSVSDADAGQAAFAAVAPASLNGTYGSFAFDSLTGVWSYTVDSTRAATQALKGGEVATETLTVHSLDGSAAQTVSVAVSGANDVAVIGGTASGNVVEAGSATGGVASTGGFLTVADPDAGEAGFAAVTPASLNGTYGTFTFNAATGVWSYALDNARAATQALSGGQVVSESFTVASLDGSASQAVSVQVTGSNDAAVIGGTVTGSVTEASGTTGLSQVSSALTVSDVDGPASFAAGSYAGSYGSVALAADGSWTYSLNNANPTVDALLTGDVLTDTVTVQAADGTTQALAITINGLTDVKIATAGNDLITGTALGDVIFGLAGNDTLSGGAGNDMIDGGVGDDVIDGGSGIDTVSYASATGSVTVNLALTTQQNTGNQGKDTITGVENLTGSGFADALTGNAGANLINGGAGNDKITGGLGADVLIGGAGTDTFIWTALADSTLAARDTILDFEGGNAAGGDVLDLSLIDAIAGTNRNDAFSFIGTAAFHHIAGELRFDTSTAGVTVVQGDTNGDGVADIEFALQWTDLAHPIVLGTGDFVL